MPIAHPKTYIFKSKEKKNIRKTSTNGISLNKQFMYILYTVSRIDAFSPHHLFSLSSDLWYSPHAPSWEHHMITITNPIFSLIYCIFFRSFFFFNFQLKHLAFKYVKVYIIVYICTGIWDMLVSRSTASAECAYYFLLLVRINIF